MAALLPRLFLLCAALAALCFAGSAFAARPSQQSETARGATTDVTGGGESSSPPSGTPEATSKPMVSIRPAMAREQMVTREPVDFFSMEEPSHVVRTVQPGESIEVHLHYSAGIPFAWEVVGGTANDRPIPTDEAFDPAVLQVIQPLEDIGVKASEITQFYSYLNDPKYEEGFTGGPMASKCVVTAPEKPGVYRVAFGLMSFVIKNEAGAVRVLEIRVGQQE